MAIRTVPLAAIVALSSLLALAPHAAQAAPSATMPTCASGDPVVWENAKSKVFHLQGDSYYGKTKSGAYACESAAVAAGYHLSGSKKTTGATPAPGTPAVTSTDAAGDAPAPVATPHSRHRHASPAPVVPTPEAT